MTETAKQDTRTGSYVPALGFRLLTPLYDPLIRITLREEEFKRRLLEEAGIRPGHAVLDVGCGTGTLAMMAKRACPEAHVTGVDGDPAVLCLAREKCARAGLDISLQEALASALPFPDGSFDRALSSLVFHHLTSETKEQVLSEIYRVLRPGGEFHIADWGRPQNALMALASLGIRFLDGAETTRANLEGRLPEMLEGAGFSGVAEVDRWMTLFGTLSLYRGTRAP